MQLQLMHVPSEIHHAKHINSHNAAFSATRVNGSFSVVALGRDKATDCAAHCSGLCVRFPSFDREVPMSLKYSVHTLDSLLLRHALLG